MSAKKQHRATAEDANAPLSKRQRHDANDNSIDTNAATQSPEDVELAFHLTRLKCAPDVHNKHAIGIQELLSGNFTTVLLTSYMYDVSWLFGECPRLCDVPVVLVHGERDRNAMENECRGYANVTLVAPFLPIPYGTHHTKMMVVVYPDKMRIAIFTANYIAIDWNNKTQGVWHQDFELKTLSDDDDDEEKETVAATDNSHQIDFEADLVGYLSCLGPKVVAFCKSEIARFDFSNANIALIPSVPGVHKDKDMEKYGHLRVRKLLQLLKVPASDHPLICQFSSMGSLDEKWLFGEFAKSLLMGKKGITATSAPVQALHIIWPSVDDVRNSLEGWNSGRAIPCSLKNMKPFLHKFLRKWTPPACLHRKNAMPHIKTYARFDPATEQETSGEKSTSGVLDWAILTSANLSKAAWGTFQRNDSQFMIRSYELGVLFLPQLLEKSRKQKTGSSASTTSSGSPAKLVVLGSKAAEQQRDKQNQFVLPLPYSFPITTYNPKTDEPWVWDVMREDPDIFGNCYLPC